MPSEPLHVEVVGAGPALFMLHGWGMHSGLWGAAVARLAQRFRVHLVDLPGHGDSRGVPLTTLDAAVDAVLAAFGEVADAIVLGWSLGGLIALRLATVAPERMRRSILVCTTPRFTTAPDWMHAVDVLTLERFGDELRASYALTLQRFLALQLGQGERGREILAPLRRVLFARGDPSPAALSAGLAILRDTDLRADLPSLRQPMLVIAGERDTLAPAGAARAMAAALPNAELCLLQGAAHVPFLSHTAVFCEAVERFAHD